MAGVSTLTLITYNPTSVAPDTGLPEILNAFWETNAGELPVVDDRNHFLGLLRLEDVVRYLDAHESPSERAALRAADLPLEHPPVFSPFEPPWAALGHLIQSNARTAVVVSDDMLEGLMTRGDFLREFSMVEHRAASSPLVDRILPVGEGLEANTPLDAAIDTLQASGVRYTAVMQATLPLGAVTLDELVERRLRWHIDRRTRGGTQTYLTLLHALKSGPHMQPGQTYGDAAAVMAERQAQALLVVNKAGRSMGVIDDRTLLETFFAIRHAL